MLLPIGRATSQKWRRRSPRWSLPARTSTLDSVVRTQTPLHWAASSDDVAALDALLDADADIEAPGAVLGGGPPLADARGFKQWKAAFRLVDRGARVTLADAATLGLLDRIHALFASTTPTADEITRAFWGACHGGRQDCAQYLLEQGADLNWIPPWEQVTPLDAAEREHADELACWLRDHGARSSRPTASIAETRPRARIALKSPTATRL